MRLEKRVGLAGLVVFTAVNIAFAQAQPDAMELLRKVEKTYRSAKSFQAEGNIASDMSGQGMHSTVEIPMVLTIVPPDRMRMENKGAPMSMLMIFNGQTIWMYMPQLNKYAKFDLGKFAGDDKGLPGYGGLGRQYLHVAERATAAKILREEAIRVDGRSVDCYVLEVEYEPPAKLPDNVPFAKSMPTNVQFSPKTMWIDKARSVVVRESSESKVTFPNSNTPMSTKQTITFAKIRLDEPVPEELFTFTPPAGATEMDLSQFIPPGIGERR